MNRILRSVSAWYVWPGRTKTYYVREAILEHLEEIEDLYLAEGALERIPQR